MLGHADRDARRAGEATGCSSQRRHLEPLEEIALADVVWRAGADHE
jgi:hypothetical protein